MNWTIAIAAIGPILGIAVEKFFRYIEIDKVREQDREDAAMASDRALEAERRSREIIVLTDLHQEIDRLAERTSNFSVTIQRSLLLLGDSPEDTRESRAWSGHLAEMDMLKSVNTVVRLASATGSDALFVVAMNLRKATEKLRDEILEAAGTETIEVVNRAMQESQRIDSISDELSLLVGKRLAAI